MQKSYLKRVLQVIRLEAENRKPIPHSVAEKIVDKTFKRLRMEGLHYMKSYVFMDLLMDRTIKRPVFDKFNQVHGDIIVNKYSKRDSPKLVFTPLDTILVDRDKEHRHLQVRGVSDLDKAISVVDSESYGNPEHYTSLMASLVMHELVHSIYDMEHHKEKRGEHCVMSTSAYTGRTGLCKSCIRKAKKFEIDQGLGAKHLHTRRRSLIGSVLRSV